MKASLSKWLAFFAACGFLTVTVIFVQTSLAPEGEGQANAAAPTPTSERKPQQTAVKLADLSVIKLTSASHQANISGLASTQAHYDVAVTGEVTGRVTYISDAFALGQQVKKGELLASINNSTQTADVKSAEQAVSQANVELLEAERESELAKKAWAVSGMGNTPSSALVFKEPQVEAAKAALASAQASLKDAQYNLAQTRIRAPFDGVITSVDVSLGEYISSGTALGQLISTDYVEVPVDFGFKQWALLPNAKELVTNEWPVVINDPLSGGEWQGTVTHVGQTLSSDTRQRTLVARVTAPFESDTPLLPGALVKLSLKGKNTEGLWKLPSSSISQSGLIWYLDDQQKLANTPANIVFNQDQYAFVTPPAALAAQSTLVVRRPLGSLVVGTRVNPVEVPNE